MTSPATDVKFGRFSNRAIHKWELNFAWSWGPLKLILIESPANPTAALVDIAMVVRIAAALEPRPLVVIDNTLLGPMMQRPKRTRPRAV